MTGKAYGVEELGMGTPEAGASLTACIRNSNGTRKSREVFRAAVM